MDKLILTNQDCQLAASKLWNCQRNVYGNRPLRIYGVPRGGIPVAYLVNGLDSNSTVVDSVGDANLVVDDIVASGRTKTRYSVDDLRRPFMALCDFISNPDKLWVSFPWERTEEGNDQSADDIVIRLLQFIGEDPKRGGLLDTPQRVLKAWKEWTAGYGQDPASVLKCFEDGAESYDQMVVVRDLAFHSHCEHHLAAFFGTATIAYLPDKRVVGLSKLGRILDIFARRLQVQERMTVQIADAIQNSLEPKGVGVVIKARHLCMESRGIGKHGNSTVTSALRGEFMSDAKVRDEFLSLAHS